MICLETEYKNFRNIGVEKISFCDGVNVIYGENAQGKTNILESIYLFSSTKSFRTKKEEEIISFFEDSARIGMKYRSLSRESAMSIHYEKGKNKRLFKNGIEIDKVSDFVGNFRCVLFSPDHLSMVKDGPFYRRNFLDMALMQIRPVYVKTYQKYNAILRQKNALLKLAANEDIKDRLDVYNMLLSEEAASIVKMRREYLCAIAPTAKSIYSDISRQKEELFIAYEAEGQKEDMGDELSRFYYSLYTHNMQREMKMGATLFGPHRDDCLLMINSKDARLYASQGQARSIVVSLKLAEGEVSKSICGEYPVFLFDDILSELDKTRQDYLLSQTTGKQIIITTCTGKGRPRFAGANKIKIKNGIIV